MNKLYWGCDAVTWSQQLNTARRRGASLRWGQIACTTMASISNTFLKAAHDNWWKCRLSKVAPRDDPIFIVGHWRSGTTFLHELLGLSPELSFLNNYCAFAPHHFLITEKYLGRGFDAMAPLRRPIDQGALNWDAPQEDEFAVCGLGAPSAYWRFGFPGENFEPLHQFDYESTERWEASFIQLITRLTARSHERIVLKSPTHSFRIDRLSTLFPKSVFVWITRDKAKTVASFDRMIKRMIKYAAFEPTTAPPIDALYDSYESVERLITHSFSRLPADRKFIVTFSETTGKPDVACSALARFLQLPMDKLWTSRLQRYTDLSHPS